jgi:membrane protein
MAVREFWSLLKEAASAWVDDYAASMGAALSYYSLFSIAPLLVLAIAIAGLFFGEEAARGEILEQMRGLVGEEGAIALQGLLQSASKPSNTVIGMATGIVVLIIGATTVFGELQTALDRIWDVPKKKRPSGIVGMLRSRLLSLGLVAAVGFLIIVSLVASAGVAALGKLWGGWFGDWQIALQIVNQVVSFAIFTGLFALVYKLLPSIRIAWRDVWVGAAATSLLFAIGKFLIGYYLSTSSVASGFGAAASIVLLLIWVYYSAQIFLLGAEFTWVYAHRRGSRSEKSAQAARPKRDAPALPPYEPGPRRAIAGAALYFGLIGRAFLQTKSKLAQKRPAERLH